MSDLECWVKEEWKQIIDQIFTCIKLNNKVKKYSEAVSNEIWKQKIDKEKCNEIKKYIGDITENIETLKKQIKQKIDRFYFTEKLNFLEIENKFREDSVPSYLISETTDVVEGSELVNSDNESVEFVTYLLITDDKDEYWKYLDALESNKNERLERVRLNLNILQKSGVVVVKNEDDVKNRINNAFETYMTQDSDLNDY